LIQRKAANEKSRGCTFDFGESRGAAFADGRVARVFADVSGIVPAALAFDAVSFVNADFERWDHFRFEVWSASTEKTDLRNNEQARQLSQMIFQTFNGYAMLGGIGAHLSTIETEAAHAHGDWDADQECV